MITINCTNCGCEIEVEADAGEHFSDIPDRCEDCNYLFSEYEKMEYYNKTQQDALDEAISRAEMLRDE